MKDVYAAQQHTRIFKQMATVCEQRPRHNPALADASIGSIRNTAWTCLAQYASLSKLHNFGPIGALKCSTH